MFSLCRELLLVNYFYLPTSLVLMLCEPTTLSKTNGMRVKSQSRHHLHTAKFIDIAVCMSR